MAWNMHWHKESLPFLVVHIWTSNFSSMDCCSLHPVLTCGYGRVLAEGFDWLDTVAAVDINPHSFADLTHIAYNTKKKIKIAIDISYLALTNQTTYEIARWKRISYLRGVPTKVHPFSKGICRNLYDLCLSRQKGYVLEAVPPLEELEARARPYTCQDVICCRCC